MPYAVCTVAAAPLRKEPNHRSEMTSQLLFGETVETLDAQDEWFKIKGTYDAYEGWVTHHLLAPVEESIAHMPARFVTTNLVAVSFQQQVFQIPMGSTLPGYDARTKTLWDGNYRFDGDCRDTTTPYTTALFQNTIRPWLNAPYLWGGKTFMGVDCSGFVQTVFKVLGVPLLRDAYQQAEQGTPIVDVANATAGDLAFFQNENGRITHVGIVLTGNKIIHASGTVRIDALTNAGIFTSGNGRQTHHLHSIKRVAIF